MTAASLSADVSIRRIVPPVVVPAIPRYVTPTERLLATLEQIGLAKLSDAPLPPRPPKDPAPTHFIQLLVAVIPT